MSATPDAATPDTAPRAPSREALARAGRLRWYHWGAVALSALLTLGVARVVDLQARERDRARFERTAEHNAALVLERMARYEGALWAGVGAIRGRSRPLTASAWRTFADSLALEVRFPGINGIGVIEPVLDEELASYEARQRRDRPGFSVHPERTADVYLPITYVEPEPTNAEAVGLDVAHEARRLAGAVRARDSGRARVTAPIVLVQDARRTPGLLLYAPFYRGAGLPADAAARRKRLAGFVYAPIIVSNLMDGVLARDGRAVTFALRDAGETLHDEHPMREGEARAARHRLVLERDVYGRRWTFDVRSTPAFEASGVSYAAPAILVGGLTLDALLLALFTAMARANRRAVALADSLTRELREESARLARSNTELELFANVASHDLREPLRMVSGFVRLLQKRYSGRLDADADRYIGFAADGAARMQALLESLLDYSRVDAGPASREPVDLGRACRDAVGDLAVLIEERCARVEIGELPTVPGDAPQLQQLFQNLLANAIRYRHLERAPHVRVDAREEGASHVVRVSDNGRGIESRHVERAFSLFERLGAEGDGNDNASGIGLAVCRKIVRRHGGTIALESEHGVGTTVRFTLAGFRADEARV